MAKQIVDGFGQVVCAFDIVRVGGTSYIVDVHGWDYAVDNEEYYDRCAAILKDLFVAENQKRQHIPRV